MKFIRLKVEFAKRNNRVKGQIIFNLTHYGVLFTHLNIILLILRENLSALTEELITG